MKLSGRLVGNRPILSLQVAVLIIKKMFPITIQMPELHTGRIIVAVYTFS